MPIKIITGVTGDQDLGAIMLRRVRVGGTANLVGAVVVKRGTTTIETLPAASTPRTELNYDGCYFGAGATEKLQINMANAGDTIIVIHD